MQELLSQLGINWQLLIAQAVNFALVLIILRLFVYGPLTKALQARRHRIEEGLAKAQEADERLRDINHIAVEKIKHAEAEGAKLLTQVEAEAKEREAALLLKAKEHEAAVLQAAEDRARARDEEAHRALEAEAALLIKQAIIRTVDLSPGAVDDALIRKALEEMKHIA